MAAILEANDVWPPPCPWRFTAAPPVTGTACFSLSLWPVLLPAVPNDHPAQPFSCPMASPVCWLQLAPGSLRHSISALLIVPTCVHCVPTPLKRETTQPAGSVLARPALHKLCGPMVPCAQKGSAPARIFSSGKILSSVTSP